MYSWTDVTHYKSRWDVFILMSTVLASLRKCDVTACSSSLCGSHWSELSSWHNWYLCFLSFILHLTVCLLLAFSSIVLQGRIRAGLCRSHVKLQRQPSPDWEIHRGAPSHWNSSEPFKLVVCVHNACWCSCACAMGNCLYARAVSDGIVEVQSWQSWDLYRFASI